MSFKMKWFSKEWDLKGKVWFYKSDFKNESMTSEDGKAWYKKGFLKVFLSDSDHG